MAMHCLPPSEISSLIQTNDQQETDTLVSSTFFGWNVSFLAVFELERASCMPRVVTGRRVQGERNSGQVSFWSTFPHEFPYFYTRFPDTSNKLPRDWGKHPETEKLGQLWNSSWIPPSFQRDIPKWLLGVHGRAWRAAGLYWITAKLPFQLHFLKEYSAPSLEYFCLPLPQKSVWNILKHQPWASAS